MKRTVTIVLTILVSLFLVSGVALANGTPTIDWYVIGGGGGQETVGSLTLYNTVGQPLIGTTMNADYDMCIGYWCWWGRLADIFLPLVLR
jgi:hypothetical protein